jgi:uncharacterized NAD-dependent epimerase/dehydratase family protein
MARPGGAAVRPSSAVILAEGLFDMEWAKTAACFIRYRPESVAAVLDSTQEGRDVSEILGFGHGIPVVSRLSKALILDPSPDALVLGIAPQGGGLPDEWRPTIGEAMRSGLDVWSGLHTFLGDDPEFAGLAEEHEVTLHDVRRPPAGLPERAARAKAVRSASSPSGRTATSGR